MLDRPIYLDHNATTPILPEVVVAMMPWLTTEHGNPSSDHPWGRRARRAVEDARAQVALLLGCDADEVVFTSGGTEANNLAIRGVADASESRRHIVTSDVEHPATSAPCAWLGRHGWRIDRMHVDDSCRVHADDLRELVSEDTALVTVIHANNETGALQPIAQLAAHARQHGAYLHADAAQSVGKIPVRVAELGVDLLSVAGHKLNAPKGIGALYIRRGTLLRPFATGAGHERGLRPGTENVASIVALGAACDLARERLATKAGTARALRDRLLARLREGVSGIALNGHDLETLPNTLNLRFPGVTGSALLAATPEVAASTGSACHAGEELASSVLLAMGLPASEALRSVRLSVGATTTVEEVDAAAAALIRGWQSAQSASAVARGPAR